jgi:DNA invertase Pin-like site-specific DNA recombinase
MSKKVFIYARRSSIKNKESSISINLQIQELTKACIEK